MKIIIPMTGKSKRFKEVGINTPKQFLSIGNKTIIEHTLDMFPGEKDINSTPRMSMKLHKEIKNSQIKIIKSMKHMAYYEKSKLVNLEIKNFLK